MRSFPYTVGVGKDVVVGRVDEIVVRRQVGLESKVSRAGEQAPRNRIKWTCEEHHWHDLID